MTPVTGVASFGESRMIIRKMSSALEFESVAKQDKSVAASIKKALESTIGNAVSGLDVLVDGDSVIVQATVPSYYIRQLVEHKSRSIIVDQLRKKFVSSVVVQS